MTTQKINLPAIHRCPVEIIQTIFENALPPIEYYPVKRHARWWLAIHICLVCHYWKEIALGTPSLWTDITVNFVRPPENLGHYWTYVTNLVKSAAATVHLRGIGRLPLVGPFRQVVPQPKYIQDLRDRFDRCSLKLIPVISTLRLDLSADCDALELLNLMKDFPNMGLERLEIDGDGQATRDPDPSRGWTTLLHQFPPFKSLLLKGCWPLYLSPSEPLTTLMDLEITNAKQVDTGTVLASCPNLQRFTMGRIGNHLMQVQDISGSHSPILSLRKLTFLQVDDVTDFAWTAISKAPSLTTVKIKVENASRQTPPAVFDFLSKHPSITSFTIRVWEPPFPRLAVVASQLINLSLNIRRMDLKEWINWKAAGLDGPLFPNLETLHLQSYDYDYPEIWVATFDALVRKRCLPRSHPNSALDDYVSPLTRLTVVAKGNWSTTQYRKSATYFKSLGNAWKENTMSWV